MAAGPYSRVERFASGVGQVVECVGYVVLKKPAYSDGTQLMPDDFVAIRGRANLEETVKLVELGARSEVERLLTHRDLFPNDDVLGYLVIGEARLPKNATLGDARTRSNGEITRLFSFDNLTQAGEFRLASQHLLFLG